MSQKTKKELNKSRQVPRRSALKIILHVVNSTSVSRITKDILTQLYCFSNNFFR